MKVHVGDRVSYKAEYSCGQLIREAGVGKVVDIKKNPVHIAHSKRCGCS
ncbi:hypothetical protein IMAU10114_00621 [Lactiplantibacillus plantarum]|nr:hypothetical protein [Lactiplantibacillus plantarum]MCG0780273.1 hypothetical protein [Lactiplantibacillus plantarum]MCG0787215.1 hypothetical protein [Lactiplantibacillus plantarum]MCG0793289.1 hypothetical protein [Lactiplantibacillus plantarum]MCG0802548.1 hypothetical protein [Lactiplantibacillus plantarum]